MIITHNMSAINSQRQMYKSMTMQAKSTEKLASGLRINKAGDDAAGLAISEKMRGQISGLIMASKNAQDGISLIQTAEGAMNEQHSMLQRMRELAVQAENDTNTSEDRAELQAEIDQLKEEITAISEKTEFNTKKLLTGELCPNNSPTANIIRDTKLKPLETQVEDINLFKQDVQKKIGEIENDKHVNNIGVKGNIFHHTVTDSKGNKYALDKLGKALGVTFPSNWQENNQDEWKVGYDKGEVLDTMNQIMSKIDDKKTHI